MSETWIDFKMTDLVKLDLDERERIGVERYGQPVRMSTKFDSLQYAYEEALDLVIYLKKELMRRDGGQPPLRENPAQVRVTIRKSPSCDVSVVYEEE